VRSEIYRRRWKLSFLCSNAIKLHKLCGVPFGCTCAGDILYRRYLLGHLPEVDLPYTGNSLILV